ncbi:hypothetical protein LWI29_014059 [Acer saccharum]|uniref:Uncharacterized protein n=1 Tax=Acer saccharum TaxID=4024 RepID=A0AA39SAU8_ACESA|nr:hypothetical protein LWI29_014059 [Acer saccharum]KAK1564723.1 hypothetical protein Q3G72_010096 [Acer saccharum]
MGNCSLKGTVDCCPNSVRVLTDSGTILEFTCPKLAGEVLESYPGYGIFPRGHASSPLADHERLISGWFYYLLPMEKEKEEKEKQKEKKEKERENVVCESVFRKQVKQVEAEKKLEVKWVEKIEPPKMSSADFVDSLGDGSGSGSALEVLPSQGNGVWRVKLVINTRQLEEILSEQVNTEALIEKMRMAASSASLTPRRSKTSWVVGWKPVFSNVFKVPVDNGK